MNLEQTEYSGIASDELVDYVLCRAEIRSSLEIELAQRLLIALTYGDAYGDAGA